MVLGQTRSVRSKKFLFFIPFASITAPPEKKRQLEETSHSRDGKELKEVVSLSKVIQLVIGWAYIWSQGTKTPSWGFCPLHYIPLLIQLSSAPLTCSAALIKFVEGWADWRIHGFEGCLVWVQLFKAPGKISKKPQQQDCISFSLPCYYREK